MRVRIGIIGIVGFALAVSAALAQESEKPAAPQPQVTPGIVVDASQKAPRPEMLTATEDNSGEEMGPYQVRQNAEFGARITSYTGNTGTWDSYVNLGTGLRLLEYSLDLHSPDHKGVLFDDLTFSNFGYGGDPNNGSRLFLQKGKTYSFNANFHRDVNIFDYNLLANPLNPTNSSPSVSVVDSPHEFLMTRRMSDMNLRLFPTSNVQFRAAWSRVTNDGTTFSSFHQGTEALLMQPTSYISDNYSAGVSLRVIPRTSINYDQFYIFYKGDTTAQLAPGGSAAVPTFTLANGTSVSLGFPFNTPANYPCAAPVLPTGFANPTCNGYTSYTRFGRVRNSYPTEQFSLQSNYWRRVDVAARAVYSDASSSMPDYGSLFAGLESRTSTVIQNIIAPPGGGANSSRLSLTADLGVTFRVTDKLRLVNQLRYNNFRVPGNWLYLTNSFFGPSLGSVPNVYSAASCPTLTSPGCPQHTSSSGADVITDSLTDFLRQATTLNTFEVEYEFTPKYSGYIGYRFERRSITDINSDNQVSVFYPTLPNRGACAGQPLVNGVCTVSSVLEAENDVVQINGNSGIMGVTARPAHKWRINGDVEVFTADNAFTRISPRHLELYKVKANYRAKDWLNVSGAVNIRENRNTAVDIGNLQHNRSYSGVATFMPASSKVGFDVSYDYNDIFSQTNICFVATPTPAGALSCGTPFLSGLSVYKELSNFASGTMFVKPTRRISTNFGYTITSTTGTTLILNPNAPTGPLSYNYHVPQAGVSIEIERHILLKAGWNYYDYNEKSQPGPTLPRDFRGNVFTLSMRYIM